VGGIYKAADNTPMNTKVSVVVPIYNVGKFLRQSVESLCQQTYRDLEIILVNDGSTDNCLEICNDFKARDSRIVVINQKNKGLVAARKAGVQRATGDYLAYVDGDDWVAPNICEYMVCCAIKHDVDVVIGGHLEDLPGRVEKLQNVISPGLYGAEQLREKVFNRMLCTDYFSQFGIFSYVWGKLYKRELVQYYQLQVDENIHIGEDAACLYPLLLASKKVYISGEALYHYRQRTDSLIKTPAPDEVEKTQYLYNFLYQKFSESCHSKSLLVQLEKFVLSLLIVRTDCRPADVNHDVALFPFTGIQPGSRIALCGAGTFGQHVARRIVAEVDYQHFVWVDELFECYQKLGLPVVSVESLSQHPFDYILIAYIDESVSEKNANSLAALGVPRSKIVRVNYEIDYIRSMLEGMGLTMDQLDFKQPVELH